MTSTGTATGRVVVVGSANADLVVQADHRPAPGETLLASASTTTPGGKGANQAVAAARMGGWVTFVGCIGRDGNAGLLRASLGGAGVDLAGLVTVDEATGLAVIVVTPDGENSIIVVPGANACLETRAVDDAARQWRDGDVVVAQLETPMDVVAHTARRAGQSGARFVLNAAPAAAVAPDVLGLCDPLVVNEDEAAALARLGSGHAEPADGAAMAAALLALGARSAVVTLGPEGAVVASAGRVEHVPAPRVQVVDTTGAGDAFVGALVAGLSRGTDLIDAARVAVAYAAATVTRRGAQAAYVGKREFEAMTSLAVRGTAAP